MAQADTGCRQIYRYQQHYLQHYQQHYLYHYLQHYLYHYAGEDVALRRHYHAVGSSATQTKPA